MGNRAIIRTENKDLEVYLHWNGGRDSVEAFLKYCELRGFRSPDTDSYGWSRLCQVVGNFFGADGLCVGISPYSGRGGLDNGIYIIKGWQIVGREDAPYIEQQEYKLEDMLKEIDNAQPKDQRLGEFLDAIEVPVSNVKIGDEVYMMETNGTFNPYKVVGFGEEKMVNGSNVSSVPYVAKYDHDGDYSWNINNYVCGDTCRIKPRQ